MQDTVNISFSLLCTIKQDGEHRWVAGCPTLDLFSQGETEAEAKRCLEEAIELWVESCLERGTLDIALREAGFAKVHPEAIRPGEEHILIDRRQGDDESVGTFPVHLLIPAYQAATFLSGRG